MPVLHSHPLIADCAVFGVPDEAYGERVHAAVQVAPGAALSAEEIRSFAKERIAGYKTPRDISLHRELPRTPSGK